MLQQIQALAATNPTRTTGVAPIAIRVVSDTQEDAPAPVTLCGWAPTPLEPPGPVSLCLWKTNAEFRAGSLAIRKGILREELLRLAVRVESECRGHRWSRKKIQEQLAAQQSADISPPQDTKELDEALAYLYEVQFVMVDEANKKVRWVPADPRNWSRERPVWGVTVGSRAVLHGPREGSVAVGLADWALAREAEKWTIAWPDAEGTVEELKAAATKGNVRIGSLTAGQKPKKADYAAAVGRAAALDHLRAEFVGEV